MKTILLQIEVPDVGHLQVKDLTVLPKTIANCPTIRIDGYKILKVIEEPYSVQNTDGVIHTSYSGGLIVFDNLKVRKTIKEAVNHPTHYNDYSVETIEMMVSIYGAEKVADWCEITAFKYRMRAGKKHDLKEDIKKEKWYLEKAKELRDVQ